MPEVVVRARERGEVEDEVDRLVDEDRLGDVVGTNRNASSADVLDVRERAADEVVDADDPVAALEQVVAEMRAEKAGSAGHQRGRHGAMLAVPLAGSAASYEALTAALAALSTG